ncbi:MAG: DEAD/DEAH box helicase [Planctomycetota bacterium]
MNGPPDADPVARSSGSPAFVVNATSGACLRFEMATWPEAARAALRRRLSYPNPEYERRAKLGLSTHDVRPRLGLVRMDGAHARIPRGALTDLAAVLEEEGGRLEVDDQRIPGEPLGGVTLSVKLRPYQERAVEALVVAEQGVVTAPWTAMGLGTIARLARSACVIVHTADLLEQWRDRVRAALGIEAGAVGGGVFDPRPVTLAMVQSLGRLPKKELEAFTARFGVVVLDEAHHAPASTFAGLISRFPARFRFGLSATPDRADGLPIEPFVGPRVFEVTRADLIRDGFLAPVRVVPIITDVAPVASPRDFAPFFAELVTDPGRNELIVRIASECAQRDRSTLVLSDRVAHCQRLAAELRAIGVDAESLTGSVKKTERAELLDRFRAGTLAVLVASQLADEGLDAPRLSRLILATPTRAAGRVIQRVGRLMRPEPGKASPIVYDLLDDHPIAKSQWRARQAAYRAALGEEARIDAPRRMPAAKGSGERPR